MIGSVSPSGFAVVGRGRGYRRQQVDRYVADLSRERDAAWERAARLTVLANELTGDAERLRGEVAQLAPQTYESLGERARQILVLAEAEDAELAVGARHEAQRQWDAAEVFSRTVREAAQQEADQVRAAVEVWVRHIVEAAQAEVDEVRIAARRDAKAWRAEALGALKEMRQRTAALLADQEREQAEQWEAEGRELTARQEAVDARIAELEERSRLKLEEAKRAYGAADEAARQGQEDAQAQAADIVAQARSREERTVRETERLLRAHAGRGEQLKAHMEHVRNSLSALAGTSDVEAPESGQVPEQVPGSTPGHGADQRSEAGRFPDSSPESGPVPDHRPERAQPAHWPDHVPGHRTELHAEQDREQGHEQVPPGHESRLAGPDGHPAGGGDGRSADVDRLAQPGRVPGPATGQQS